MDCFQFKLVALLTIYCNLFDMKQKIKNKFLSKSATYKIVLKLGMFAASYLARKQELQDKQSKGINKRLRMIMQSSLFK